MKQGTLTSGELAKRAGTTRKALRIYEKAGLVLPAHRTGAGYRLYGPAAVDLVKFIVKARSIGFTVSDIRNVVGIKRSGRAPCTHVRALVQQKIADVDKALADLKDAREELSSLLCSWQRMPRTKATVCAHIEGLTVPVREEGKR